MKKKLLITVILFFFILSSWSSAAKKTQIKEFIGYYSSPSLDYMIVPADHTQKEEFVSDPFLTIQVPASQESNAIFFDIFAQVIFKWSDNLDRIADCKVVLNIISDVIPSNIEVNTSNAVLSVSEKNFAGNYDTSYFRRSWKRNWWIMSREEKNNYFEVKFKSGGDVPEERAKKIINDLIDNGFSVEIHTIGSIQGVSILYFLTCQVEVTRIAEIKLKLLGL